MKKYKIDFINVEGEKFELPDDAIVISGELDEVGIKNPRRIFRIAYMIPLDKCKDERSD